MSVWSTRNKGEVVCVYSLRAKDRPTVSTPVSWEEVDGAARGDVALSFETADVLERIRQHGDLFAPVESVKQELPVV